MIDAWPVKVGVAGLLLGAVWGLGFGIEAAGATVWRTIRA